MRRRAPPITLPAALVGTSDVRIGPLRASVVSIAVSIIVPVATPIVTGGIVSPAVRRHATGRATRGVARRVVCVTGGTSPRRISVVFAFAGSGAHHDRRRTHPLPEADPADAQSYGRRPMARRRGVHRLRAALSDTPPVSDAGRQCSPSSPRPVRPSPIVRCSSHVVHPATLRAASPDALPVSVGARRVRHIPAASSTSAAPSDVPPVTTGIDFVSTDTTGVRRPCPPQGTLPGERRLLRAADPAS